MYYRSPGVQHIALRTDDIVATVAGMQAAGVGFLRVPDTYYEEVRDRVPEVAGELEALQASGILVDADEDGYLLQIFTRPLQDRPTFFLEVIERHGSLGFGRQLQGAVRVHRREQAMRGESLMDAVWSKGTVARQAHVGVPDGTYEEEHGRETFFGRSSHLYGCILRRRGSPSKDRSGPAPSISTR